MEECLEGSSQGTPVRARELGGRWARRLCVFVHVWKSCVYAGPDGVFKNFSGERLAEAVSPGRSPPGGGGNGVQAAAQFAFPTSRCPRHRGAAQPTSSPGRWAVPSWGGRAEGVGMGGVRLGEGHLQSWRLEKRKRRDG